MIEPGWQVVGRDGEELATVHEVLGETNADIFDGLSVMPGLLKSPKYVPAERVRTIVEGRVDLDVTAEEFERIDEEPPG